MSDLVEFRHLKYIVAVAETANFTRAAERLFLAQPSLSKQIKDLEDEIGFPIFVRNRDGVRITPAGQMIIAYAQEALSARGEIITMARAVHKGEVAPLRLGFSPFVNPELLEFFRDALCQPLSQIARSICQAAIPCIFFSGSNRKTSMVRFFRCRSTVRIG